MNTDRQRIQTALIEAGKEGPWFPVKYDNAGNPDVNFRSPVTPDTVLVDETEATFEDAERNRQQVRLKERDVWLFQLVVDFSNGTIHCTGFEDKMRQGGILLKSNKAKGVAQVTLELERAEYSHPPTKDTQSGSRVVYTFAASQSLY